jgi:hypothetical protein
MFVGWAFICGLPGALPLAFLAARSAAQQRRAWVQAGWSLLAFAMFFWSCEMLLLWKSSRIVS